MPMGNCPGIQYVSYLLKICKSQLQDEMVDFQKQMARSRERAVSCDIARGGTFAFAGTRDPQVPPFSCIQDKISVPISPHEVEKGRQ